MSNDLNRCEYIGRLGKDPEVRYMPSGVAVANFSIAVNEAYKDKNTGEKINKVEWVNIVAWRKLGEICGEYLKKGSKVYVAGKSKTRKWQDQQGQDRYTTEIIASEIQMLDSRQPENGGVPESSRVPENGGVPESGFDDDIPF